MADNMLLKVLLHAPTATALQRARNNASNLLRDAPDAEVRIVANAEAVVAALEQPHDVLDAITWLCPNTLQRANRTAHEPLHVLARAAVLEIAQMQQQGWVYVRA